MSGTKRPDHFLRPLLSEASGKALVIEERDHPLATTLELAADSTARRRGLLGRRELAPHTALIIAPCNAVHTFGMQFTIDVIFTARDGRVVKIVRSIGPRRIAVAWGAFAAIELAAGEAERHGVNRGDHLLVRS